MLRIIKNNLKRIFNLDATSLNTPSTINKFTSDITPVSETKPNDIFIVGFPKSGNTLMQHILVHLYYGLNEEGSRTMVDLIVPDIYTNSHYFRINDVCFFKSHNRPLPNYKKVIYLIRDGREALLSYYHMMKNMGNEVDLEALYSGKISIFGGTWSQHINEWESNPYNSEILWVRYEDLKANKLKELERICKFLNIERNTSELEKVAYLSSLEHMKNLEKREDWQKMNISLNLNQGNFVRKGLLNSYKDEVPEDYIKNFEKNSKNNFYTFK